MLSLEVSKFCSGQFSCCADSEGCPEEPRFYRIEHSPMRLPTTPKTDNFGETVHFVCELHRKGSESSREGWLPITPEVLSAIAAAVLAAA